MKIKLGRNHFKNLLRIGLGSCLLLAASGGIYYALVVNELELKLKALELRGQSLDSETSILEQGSITKHDELKGFLEFLKSPLNINDEIEKETIRVQGDRVLVLKDFELPGLLDNNCDRFRCLQHRISFSEIPSSLWKGLLGIEDYRFLQHQGVDYISIARAIVADIKAMSLVQGGSTLTQQLAKNMFLSNEKKLERKVREMIYALYLEKSFSKEQIITMYFNEVFWGTVGGVYIKGIDMASRAYFNKTPLELTDFEAAMLIGMLKGPYYYHPLNHPERLKQRTNVVFNRLKELKLVTSDEGVQWSENKWSKWRGELKAKNSSSLLKSIYLTGENAQPGLEPFEKFIFYQSVAKVRGGLAERTKDVDIGVKSLIIDADCTSIECDNKFSYYSKFERNTDDAIFNERHQVGSSLKPIIYQQLLEEGKTLEDEVSTAPITLDLISGKWTPQDSKVDLGPYISLRKAIQKSRNIPLIRAAQEVGFENLETRLIDYFPNLLTPLAQYPAQLLGSIELSLSEIGQAYLKFFKSQCETFERGESSYEESLLYHLAQAEKTTISAAAGKIIKQSLIFGKTGTTNNGLDNWYIAFDGQNFYAIWFGVDSRREGKNLRLYGSNSSFAIFQNFIQYRGKQVSEFLCPSVENKL